jgi:hypothetical protein
MSLVTGSTTGLVIVDVSEGSKMVNLPSISQLPGRIVTVKDNGSASSTNTVTLVPTAGNTFESGDASYLLNAPFAYVTFIGDSSTLKWRVVGKSYVNTSSGSSDTGVAGDASLTSATVAGPLIVTGQTTLGNTNNTGTLAVTGNTTLGMLTATNINFTGSLMSNGTVFSGGSATAGINTSGNVGIGGAAGSATLLVSGSQSNTGPLGVAGNTTVSGMLSVSGQTTLGNTSNTGTLGVAGATTLGSASVGTLSVTGSATLSSLSVSGQTTLANTSNTGSLGVAGAASFGSATVAGALNTQILSTSSAYIKNAYIENISANVLYVNIVSTAITEDIASMEVDNATVSSAKISSITAGNLEVSGPLSVTGLTSLVNSSNTGSLGVAGATTLASATASTLGVSGATTLASASATSLSVTGQTTLASATASTLGVAGETTLASASATSLGVSGLTTLANTSNSGTLGVAGATTLASASATSLSVTGQTTLVNSSNTGTLGVAGATTLASASATSLGVSGLTTLANTSNTGTLGVAGATTLGTLTATNINFTGSLMSNGSAFTGGAVAGINSSGNVGIGGAAGSTNLLVNGSQSNTGTLGVAGNTTLGGHLSLYTANGGTWAITSLENGVSQNRIWFSSSNSGVGSATIYDVPANTHPSPTRSLSHLFRYNNSVELMTLDNTGNAVITGTTSTTGLQIRGTGWNVTDASGGVRMLFAPNGATQMYSPTYFEWNTGASTYMMKMSSNALDNGNPYWLAIGANHTATCSLDVKGSGKFSGTLRVATLLSQWGITSDDNVARIGFFSNGWTAFNTPNSCGYSFRVNGNEVSYINSSGGITCSFINVTSAVSLSYGAGSYFSVGSAGQTIQPTAASARPLSITAPNFIFSGEGFLAASDERIKKNIAPVVDSLDVVKSFNLVSYDYIDFNKNPVKHGLIAQQVKEVYPEAVIKTKEFIPSVFKLATSCTKAENLTITSPVATGFAVSDKIRLFISDDTTYENEEKYETEVLEIISETEFVVKASEKFTQGMNVFIYGKEVNDFLAIDKPLIGLLAAGACQTLSGQVSTLQAENVELRSTIAAILQKYPL